jgi:hypothetical protein
MIDAGNGAGRHGQRRSSLRRTRERTSLISRILSNAARPR